tara:strand:+ start:482 stop:835 length:354 start_codon:yes stop_codon:yes gene_type:complete
MFQPGDLNTRVKVAQFENFGDGGYGGYNEETGGQDSKFVWCKWEPTGGEIKQEDGRDIQYESVTAIFRKNSVYPMSSTNISSNTFVLLNGQKYQIEALYDNKYKYFVEAKLITMINP